MVGARAVLSWLETFPGDTWQQRWESTPAATKHRRWYEQVREWARTIDKTPTVGSVQSGMLALIYVDALRPDLQWLVSNCSRFIRPAIQATRDPDGVGGG
ncbi:hypothetical protein [Streptomyces mirabilis]|uniref:hypothetical protein n=1 Tax=Streptomyces mirabilis TaxID=68239 RepID=UPI00225262E3|nr:hypothetical protein [Streptomyces mirabilis]MCX4428343.1 hypothetical protein [Streptomyces mirabilis]